MNALAFDARDQDVLLARAELDSSHNRLVYLIERWSRLTGKVTGTVSLPGRAWSPQDGYSPISGRLVFSADRKSLLSIPAEPGKRATVWDLAAAKPLHEFENDFIAGSILPGRSPNHRDDGIGNRRPGCHDRRGDQTMADARWPRLVHGEPEEQPTA